MDNNLATYLIILNLVNDISADAYELVKRYQIGF